MTWWESGPSSPPTTSNEKSGERAGSASPLHDAHTDAAFVGEQPRVDRRDALTRPALQRFAQRRRHDVLDDVARDDSADGDAEASRQIRFEHGQEAARGAAGGRQALQLRRVQRGGRQVDRVGDRFAAQGGQRRGADDLADGGQRLGAGAAGVGGEDRRRQAEERACDGWFMREDVDAGAAIRPSASASASASSSTTPPRAALMTIALRLELGDRVAVEHVKRLGILRDVERHHVGGLAGASRSRPEPRPAR